MKQRLRAVILFVLLGTIVNIAIAWAFALFGSFDRSSLVHEFRADAISTAESLGTSMWPIEAPSDWPRPSSAAWREIRGLQWDYAFGSQHSAGFKRLYSMKVVRCGWPCHSMRWFDAMVSDSDNSQIERFGQRWIRVPDWIEHIAENWTEGFPMRRRLPIEPLWPGFVFNSLCFGAGLWLIMRGPRDVRTFVRRRHQRCENCGYLIGTSPVCTECGAPLPRPAITSITGTDPSH